MRSDLKLALLGGIGTLLLLATALAVGDEAGQNLVVNGDFENGNTAFTSGYTLGDVSNPGFYAIGTNPSTAAGAFGDWCNCGDHTSGTGKMMIVNGATDASLPIWEETVAVRPSTSYTFSYWGAEVDHDSSSLPHLSVRINAAQLEAVPFRSILPTTEVSSKTTSSYGNRVRAKARTWPFST